MIISWFSGGITSAVACKMAQLKHENVQPVFIETGSHHQDMKRFLSDCEAWFKVKIKILQDERFKDHIDLCEKKRVVNFINGAECSRTLKKRQRQIYQKSVEFEHQVFGFEFEKKEINRAVRFKEQNPETKPIFPLIEHQLTKANCLDIVSRAGIEKPAMYRLGYSNNNCIGCVKGGMGYWNKIRVDFPDWFKRMAEVERKIGRTCLKETYLDELDPSAGKEQKMIMPECDLFCEIEAVDILAGETIRILGEQK